MRLRLDRLILALCVGTLAACGGLFDFGDGEGLFGSGISIPLPEQVGGLTPVDGTDLLDASFAQDGIATPLDFAENTPIRVVADSQSRLLVVGLNHSPPGVRLERLSEDGALDPSFGTKGAIVLEDDQSGSALAGTSAPSIEIDDGGRIWLLFTRSRSDTGEYEAVVVRLTADGVLDSGFGSAGWVFIDTSPELSDTHAVDLVGDGGGGAYVCVTEVRLSSSRMWVARLTGSGLLDASYGDGGLARGPEEDATLAAAMDLDGAGRIVVCGNLLSAGRPVVLWRFDGEGEADSEFDGIGLVVQGDVVGSSTIELQAVDVVTDSMNRVVVLANRSTDLAEIYDWPSQFVDFEDEPNPVFDALVWRFQPDGSRDIDFADGGKRTLAFNSGPYVSVSGGHRGGDHFDVAVGLQHDPQTFTITVAGWSDVGIWATTSGWATFGPTRPFVVRLKATGEYDGTLRDGGHIQLAWEPMGSTVHARGHVSSFAVDPEGRWLLPGLWSTGGHRIRRVSPGD